MSNSDFSLCHYLKATLKVLLMDQEAKTHMGGQAIHGLWESNMTMRKFLPKGCQISCIFDLKLIILAGVNQLYLFFQIY